MRQEVDLNVRCSGAVLCGCVEVGNCSFIGAGAVVLKPILGKVTVGAGSLVNSDIIRIQ